MHTTNLRKVGGSVMLAVPPALLKLLQLGPGPEWISALRTTAWLSRPGHGQGTRSMSCWHNAMRPPPRLAKIVPGLTRSQSATNCCNEARRHLARQPRSYCRP